MERIKRIATAALFLLILCGFSVSAIFLPDQDISAAERRKLQQVPELSVDAVVSKEYMTDLEKYLQDQFPLREDFRRIKAVFRKNILHQSDINGIYVTDSGSAVKIEKELKTDQVLFCANKINALTERFLQDCHVYAAVIPDKNYYAAEPNARPHLNYDKMMSTFTKQLKNVTYIDLFDTLTLDDYYLSDAHWKQDHLQKPRDTIATAMGLSLPPLSSYQKETLFPFNGVYRGQSALPVKQDNLTFLTNPATASATVTSEELKGPLSVYAPDKFTNNDAYDVFLHGPQAILTIENPKASTDRELYIFRDSFGSSFTPLMIDGYRKIIMIDLRYVTTDYMSTLVSFKPGQDALFLYSVGLVNSGMLLR
ncbi:MAG: DHHW family protein [Evtepia sp.]